MGFDYNVIIIPFIVVFLLLGGVVTGLIISLFVKDVLDKRRNERRIRDEKELELQKNVAEEKEKNRIEIPDEEEKKEGENEEEGEIVEEVEEIVEEE